MWKAAIASLTAGGALVVSAIGGALPVAAVHPPTLIAEYSCSAKHESFLANDNGSGEFARLGYGTLIIAGPDGVVPNDPADHHPFAWTWTQTNDYNALNIGKMKFLHADGLMLPAGLYTVSQTFPDQSTVSATFSVPSPDPARGGCPDPSQGSGGSGSGGSGGGVTSDPPTADPPSSTTSGGTSAGKPASSTSGLADPADPLADPPGLPATGNDPGA